MKKFTWEQFYDSFWDWTENTQAQYTYGLMTLGPVNEVAEVIIELQCSDVGKEAANKLLAKAVEASFEFAADDLIEFSCDLDRKTVEAAVISSVNTLSEEDLNELYECGDFDEAFIASMFIARGFDLPDDLYDEYGEPYESQGASVIGSVFNTTFDEPFKVVKCTQCGANVELDLSKGTANCKYCSTSFIITPSKQIVPVSQTEKKPKQYTWEEYYDKFWDWSDSIQVKNLDALTSIGNVSEVAEVLSALTFDAKAGGKLLAKAVAARYAFDGDDLVEFAGDYDIALVEKAVRNSAARLSAENMEELYGLIDDDIIIEICKQRNIPLPEDLRDEEEDDYEYIAPAPKQQAKKPGLLWALLGAFAAGGLDNTKSQTHNGRCNGDCANCPPHYGYRYGRWYYGHDHAHGCEFGGNKCSGSMD